MHAVLIRRCQAGDDAAFALLFVHYKNLVYRTAYLMLGTAADAEDVLQEVFLQVHRSLDGYDPHRGSFSTWLHRITVNRCLNWRRGRHVAESLESVAGQDEEAVRSSMDGLADRDSVRSALDGLSDRLRVTVVLRYYWDLSYEEIADVLELPLGTVKSRLNRAMRNMKDDLEPDLSVQAHAFVEAER
jgi:RNA polymerase sigma-70 factor, ECF subfamily